MSVHGIIRGQNKMKNGRIGPLRYPIAKEKELDRESQLGPSLACQPKAPTSECLLPSFFCVVVPTIPGLDSGSNHSIVTLGKGTEGYLYRFYPSPLRLTTVPAGVRTRFRTRRLRESESLTTILAACGLELGLSTE